MSHRTVIAVVTALVGLALVVGCEKSEGAAAEEREGAAQQSSDEEHHAGEHHGDEHRAEGGHHGERATKVDVPKKGEEFDPPVSADRVPEGAWHCNMNGKVHYAALEKGDGRCPVCNMKLQQAK